MRAEIIASPQAERGLWGAVLWQVLVDLASSNRHDREAAEAWIGQAPSRDFKMVCDLIGLDPDPAHRFLAGVIALPKEARRAFGYGETGRTSHSVASAFAVTAPELAKLVGLTPARIGQLAQAGRLDGCFEVIGARRIYRTEAARAALAALGCRGRLGDRR